LSPTDCARALREIEQYLDGELDRAQAQEIAEHLEGCPPCMRKAVFQRKMHEVIGRSCGSKDMPETMRIRIQRIWVELSGESD